MKTLTEFGLWDKSVWRTESHLGGLALELAFHVKTTSPELSRQLRELGLSLLNLSITSLLAYERIAQYARHVTLIEDLNKQWTTLQLMSEFAQSFLILTKSKLDLASCILDAVENRTFRQEHQLSDSRRVARSTKGLGPVMNALLDEFWVVSAESARNKVVHRGAIVRYKITTADEHYAQRIKELMVTPGWPHGTQLPIRDEFQPTVSSQLIKTHMGRSDRGVVDGDWTSDGAGNLTIPLELEPIAHGTLYGFADWEQKVIMEMRAQGRVTEFPRLFSKVCQVGLRTSNPDQWKPRLKSSITKPSRRRQ